MGWGTRLQIVSVFVEREGDKQGGRGGDTFEAKYVFFSLDLMTFWPRTFLIREPNLFVYLVFRVSLSENQVL